MLCYVYSMYTEEWNEIFEYLSKIREKKKNASFG